MSSKDRTFRQFNNGRGQLPPEFRGPVGPTAPPVALDRLGREIVPGALVLLEHNATDIVFQVAAVKPLLLPDAPQGAMEVVLVATVPITMGRAQPSSRMFVVGYPDEVPAGDPPATSDPTPPPGDHP